MWVSYELHTQVKGHVLNKRYGNYTNVKFTTRPYLYVLLILLGHGFYRWCFLRVCIH